MTPQPSSRPELDLAAAAILDAPDRTELAAALCDGVAKCVPATMVILLDAGSREVARSGPDGDDGTADANHAAAEGKSVAVRDRSLSTDVATTFTVQPDITLVVYRELDEDGAEVCRLLIDLTTAALDRMQSEDLVAEQQLRYRRLGDRLLNLGFDSAAEASETVAASDLAVAAALLTQREREVLEQVVAGASNAAIAEKYTLSVETVKTHVKHILRKLGATNRAELIGRSM
ncbi:helix-turn-helix transcriptional regulator [Gordonia westfalica]|uniref:Regulatory protein, luxR family n=1 Tax=Gordonia westfalica TaxID=158898 RepID=A0A1H2LGW0_9ACTN|nr:LuxR family transcriptional regulator [Gordonia westfalica]SDU79646.1 regulatory protein, luxR family [Gordonia westfalica]